MPTVALQPIDYEVMLAYFTEVLGVGLWVRRAVHTSDASTDQAGRAA